jgi:2-keto-3-deoxy-L-rhamnonate aldolase RhmA
MTGKFRSRLAAGERLFGTMVTLPTPSTAEILADVGFDWLFIDGEHGPFDMGDIVAILQAVGDRVACIVRVPVAEEAPIKRVLDVGAEGIICPQVNTPELAANVVRWSRYAPEGLRGVGLGRAHGYGMKFQEYVDTANQQVTVIVQAEHAQAVENIEAIAAIAGVDAVLLGPYDLASSYNKMGLIDDPQVTGAIDRITDVCQAANMPLGYFGVTADAVRPFVERGYQLIVTGVDTVFLGSAAKKTLSQLQ